MVRLISDQRITRFFFFLEMIYVVRLILDQRITRFFFFLEMIYVVRLISDQRITRFFFLEMIYYPEEGQFEDAEDDKYVLLLSHFTVSVTRNLSPITCYP